MKLFVNTALDVLDGNLDCLSLCGTTCPSNSFSSKNSPFGVLNTFLSFSHLPHHHHHLSH